MAKSYSGDIHTLIQSLSKSEKRYFNLYVARHSSGANNYKILFDYISKQKEYNEEILLKKFKNEAFIKRFSITKARLYDTVLKSLDAFYAESSTEQKLRMQIHYIEILFKKSLYKLCKKEILSAKKLAVKHEKNTLLIEIINWEKKIIEKDNYANFSEKELQKLTQLEQKATTEISNRQNLWNIKSSLFINLNKRGRIRSEEEIESVRKEVIEPLLKLDSKSFNYRHQYSFYHIQAAYYFAICDYPNSLIQAKKVIDVLAKQTKTSNLLFSEIANAAYLCVQLKKYDEALTFIEQLRKIAEDQEENSQDIHIKLFSTIYSLELILMHQTGNVKNASELIHNIDQFIFQYQAKINPLRLAFFYFHLSALNLVIESPTEAGRWSNKLLNEIRIDQNQEIYALGQILHLFIHLELKNNDFIVYLIRSVKRYLETRNKFFEFEHILLQFLGKYTKAKYEMDINNSYTWLYEKLQQLEGTYQKIPFEYFDFLAWVEGRLKDKKMVVLLQEKSKFNY